MKRRIAILCLLLAACGGGVTVRDLTIAPRRWAGKEVVVAGKVERPGNIGGIRCYLLVDRGAKVLVETKGDLPQEGDRARVRGRAVYRQDLTEEGGETGVKLEEIERR